MLLKIGVTAEESQSPDSLVCFSPEQCKLLQKQFQIQFVVQPANNRCYTDKEYTEAGITVQANLSDCDCLFSVYDTPIHKISEGTKLFTFAYSQSSHASNKGLYNICELKGGTLVDIDLLQDHQNTPIITIHKIAGRVGMHNALIALGKSTKAFELPEIKSNHTFEDLLETYKNVKLPYLKFVIIGTGQEALGAIEILEALGIKKITPELFVLREFPEAVYTHINEYYCAKRKDKLPFTMTEFYAEPQAFESDFSYFLNTTDVLINGYAKRPGAPVLFKEEIMNQKDFRIKLIADINAITSADNAIPCIKQINYIDNPFYGYDRNTRQIVDPFLPDSIDIMAAGKLPSALSKETSTHIGKSISQYLIPELLLKEESRLIKKATIFLNGEPVDKESIS